MKATEQYHALPRKVSQQVLMLLDRSWKSFFAASKAYTEQPDTFTGKPRIPGYLDKTKGRYALVYTLQAVSRPALAQQVIKRRGWRLRSRPNRPGSRRYVSFHGAAFMW